MPDLPPTERADMELQDYARVVARQWRTLASVAVAALIVAAVITMLVPRQYVSEARLFVSADQTTADAYQGGLFAQQRAATYADIATSETIARGVVDRLDIRQSPREVASRITATVEPETVVLSISTTDRSASTARTLTQAVALELVDYVTKLETPEDADAPSIALRIIEPADAPGAPSSPNLLVNLLIGLVLGLLLGVALALRREVSDRRIRDDVGLRAATGGLQLLGRVTSEPSAQDNPLKPDADARTRLADTFGIVATHLQTLAARGQTIILVASAGSADGRTSTAVHLATALATSDHRVLVIETDLRDPSLARGLGIASSPGLSEVVSSQTDLESAVQQVAPNLDVLTSGASFVSPLEMLRNENFAEMVSRAGAAYAMVVLDSPPTLPVADASVLARLADATVFVVRHEHTTKDDARAALLRLETVGAHLVGVITTAVPPPSARAGGSSSRSRKKSATVDHPATRRQPKPRRSAGRD